MSTEKTEEGLGVPAAEGALQTVIQKDDRKREQGQSGEMQRCKASDREGGDGERGTTEMGETEPAGQGPAVSGWTGRDGEARRETAAQW